MKILIFGATGLVGQGVLRESLLADDVQEVLAVGRSATGVQHPKLRELRHDDFTDFSAIADQLAGFDARLWPTHGAVPTASSYGVLNRITGLLHPVIERIVPQFATTTDRLGRAMLRVARAGAPDRVVSGRDLR